MLGMRGAPFIPLGAWISRGCAGRQPGCGRRAPNPNLNPNPNPNPNPNCGEVILRLENKTSGPAPTSPEAQAEEAAEALDVAVFKDSIQGLALGQPHVSPIG